MKARLIFSLFLLSFNAPVFCQEPSQALRELFTDAEYFLASEYYTDALPEYLKIYKRGFADNANLNYRIGICYLNIPGQKKEAIPYLEKASQKLSGNYVEGNLRENNAPYDALLYLGNAYRIDNQLDKAIITYGEYLNKIKDLKDNPEMIAYTNKQIEGCKIAKELQKNPATLKKENLGAAINNSADNYKPVISGDEKTLAYMNKLKFYDAIFLSRKVNGSWAEPENITPLIQSDGDQFTCFLSFDGNTLYLTREDQFNSDIVISEYKNGAWTPSRPLNKTVNTKFWESHASTTADGKILYFASNRNNGLGGMDIYMAERLSNGEWGEAKNIGNAINTNLNEDCPFISPDGKTLFFSSQGHYNMGGYDLFVSHKDEIGQWSAPQNLGNPLNSTDDDMFFSPVGDGHVVYAALIDKNGMGNEDIYRIEWTPPSTLASVSEKEPVKESKPDTLLAQKEEPVKQELVNEPVKEEPKEPIKEENKIDESPVQKEEPVKKETPKEPQKWVISPIFFEFNQALLSSESKRILDILVSALKENTSITVEITGHTDSKGSDEYNLVLGEKRAQIVKNYMVSRGIAESRLAVVSEGERKPVAQNMTANGSDSPNGRMLNRRIEFKILSGNNGLIIIQPITVPENLRIQ